VLFGRRRPGGRGGRDHEGQPRQGREHLPHLPPRARERRCRVWHRHRARLLLQGRPRARPPAVRRDLVQDQGQQVSPAAAISSHNTLSVTIIDPVYRLLRIKIFPCIASSYATANVTVYLYS
jgi:hypothetical protein